MYPFIRCFYYLQKKIEFQFWSGLNLGLFGWRVALMGVSRFGRPCPVLELILSLARFLIWARVSLNIFIYSFNSLVNSLLGALGQQTLTAQSTIFTETNNATLQVPTHLLIRQIFNGMIAKIGSTILMSQYTKIYKDQL